MINSYLNKGYHKAIEKIQINNIKYYFLLLTPYFFSMPFPNNRTNLLSNPQKK